MMIRAASVSDLALPAPTGSNTSRTPLLPRSAFGRLRLWRGQDQRLNGGED